MKSKLDEKIQRMRNGEKVECPRCKDGHFMAVGDPKTTKVFRCDSCRTGMTLTVPYKKL